MFIGRENELKKLNTMYAGDKLEVAVIYGRRRVGKTTLISEFCKNKKTVFFPAVESDAAQNLETLSAAIRYTQAEESGAAFTFRSFADAFLKIAEIAREERIVFAIDEFPYLAKAQNGISSLLQNYIDHQFKDSRLFLILCGSSMSFMEEQVLGYQSPLYGRRTAQFKIEPFDYLDTGKFFPAYSPEEKAFMYGISGGVPFYLEEFSPALSIKENLLEKLFQKNALLYEEPSNLLKQELREPATYNAIITAVASGKTKLSEITSTVAMETGLCSKYISNLISLGILKKEVPVTEPKSKHPYYRIEDQFFRFWYTFVPKNWAAIISGRIEKSFDRAVGQYLSDYMGITFEKMCRDFILFYDDKLPFDLSLIGQWWGGNPKRKSPAQIDVVAVSQLSGQGIIGSCKFTGEKVGMDEYELMQEYGDAMGAIYDRYYYFFSKAGFTKALYEKKGERVRLITLEEMYEI